MTNRREFIKTTAAIAGGLSIPSFLLSGCNKAAAAEKRIGLQIYSVRDALGKDIPGTLQKVAAIGYKNLDLPPQHLDTGALAWAPSDPAIAPLIHEGLRPLDGLQGVRNLAITVFPILARCDRMDV